MATKQYIKPRQIAEDWDVSISTAYNIIRELNKAIKAKYPTAIVLAGKVNKKWYDQACLQNIDLHQKGGK